MAVGKQNLVILSKLQAPQIKTKILHRKRLIDSLSKNLDKKVILLYAGAGYGKTTLLSQFISSKKILYVYYHLEKSDVEPAVFLSYLIAGIRKIEPEFGEKTESLSHFFNYPKKYLELITGTFINEIIKCITQDLFIILEDYHSLTPSSQVDRILSYILEHLPPQLHFIITSRTKPSILPSRLKTRDEMFEINSQNLRFTKAEIRYLFEKIYSVSLKGSEIEWIAEHSEGWPTSLRLMLQSSDYLKGIKSSDYVRKFLRSYQQSQTHLFNYFAQEIYNQEPEQIRKFLVDCSILEWLTPDLCNAITGRKDSGNILSDLTKRNAFLFKIPEVGYRFHNLFRDFLRSKSTDIKRVKRIYRDAGIFCAKNNNLEEAVKFYLQAGEYIKAASIIEKIGFRLSEQGKSGILCSYIEELPDAIRKQRPELLMNYAQTLIYIGRFDEAKNLCLKAARILKKGAKNHTKYANALYKLGGINLNQGKFKIAKKWFINALSVCPRNSKLIRASILNSIGSVHNSISGKHMRNAVQYFEKALCIAQKNKYKELETSILNNWAWNELKVGNLNQAHSKLSRMVRLLEKYFSFGCGAGFYNASRLSLLLGYKKKARSILDLGSKTCGAYNDLWSMATIWHGYALLYEELGNTIKAKQFISKSLDIYEKLGLVRMVITALNEMCKMNIATEDISIAEKNLSAIWGIKKNRDDADAIPILLTEAKLKIAQGKLSEAEGFLLNILKLSRRTKQIFDSFLINIELSKVVHTQGKLQEALAALKEAIMISRAKGYNYLLLKELQTEKWMLQSINKDNIEKKYVVSIIKNSHLNIHWIDASFFGIPKVFIDDHEIENGSWKTVKAKKLFFYLLLHKNEKMNRDNLINILWHNATPKSGRSNLRKTIQYIRETFKSNVSTIDDLIVLSKGLYQISPQVSVWLDIDEFQNAVNQIKSLKRQDELLKSYLLKAISVYNKGFAVGWYDVWADDMRRYYDGLYEDCLNMMAKFYFRKNKFKQAVIWYKKLLSLNFLDEKYHRKLMTAHAQLEKYKEITQDFEKLRSVLKKELGVEPQQKTTNLYKSLIK